MIQTVCQGCGRTERIDDRRKDDPPVQIRETRFEVPGWNGRSAVTADLCPRCVDRLLASFYGIEPGGRTDLELERDALLGPPTFPRMLEPTGDGETFVDPIVLRDARVVE